MAGAKQTPRQKMIGMMYLVLTALLALNISKEVLNGFVKVENSLISTQQTIADKVDETYTALNAKYNSNQEKVGPFFEKGEDISKDAKELVTYISQLKARCMATSEGKYEQQDEVNFEDYYGIDKYGRDTVLNLKHIQKKDEYQALTTFMVGSEPAAPIEGKWTAQGLRIALEKYRDDLLNISVIDNEGNERILPESIKKSLQERFSFEDEYENDVLVNWEAANFYDVPLAAVMPLMSKMIIDVQDSEAEIMNWLLSGIEAKSLKFSEVKPLIIPQSNYVIKGDTARAEILLAAFDPTRIPEVYVQNEKWDGVDSSEIDYTTLEALPVSFDGSGLYSLSTKGMKLGQYQYRGVIRYQGPDGTMQSQDFTTPIFTVADPGLVVSPTAMNVFYRGMENPVKISVPGFSNDKITATISGGHKITRKADGSYIVVPKKSSSFKEAEAFISVTGKMPDGSTAQLGREKFRVRVLPNPEPEWAARRAQNKTISENDILAFAPIAAKLDDFLFDVKVSPKSFTLLIRNKGQWSELKSGNQQLTPDMKSILQKARRGDLIFFNDIVVPMPDGTERILNMKLKVG